MKKLITLFLVLTGIVCSASATDYYVGANTVNDGAGWAIQGQMTDADGDGTYSLIIQVPARVYVDGTDANDKLRMFYFTVFSSSTIDWNYAYRPTGGEKWINNTVSEIAMDENPSSSGGTIGYGSAYGDDTNKNFASALKIEYTPEENKVKATRLIAVASAKNSFSTTTDYLTETSHGSQQYSGKVELTTGGFKFFLRQWGWDYWGRKADSQSDGIWYIVNTDGDNVAVASDGVYNLTADLTNFHWTDPVRVTATISTGTYGKATFCSNYDLDFTGITDVQAYTITGAAANGVLTTAQQTGKVPAGTGLYIEGTSANVPTTLSASSVGTNMLVAGTGAKVSQIDGTKTNFVLTTNKGMSATPKFYKVNSEGNTVVVGKAYLQIPTASVGAREFFWFDDEETTTGLDKVADNKQVAEYYNLSGQRVAQPVKGLYIVNGKKVIIK